MSNTCINIFTYIFVYMCLYMHLIMCVYPLIINMSHLIHKLHLHNLVLSPNNINTYKLITTSGSQGNIYLYFSLLCQIM